MKNWIPLAIAYLDKSLGKIPSELNEIDWKARQAGCTNIKID